MNRTALRRAAFAEEALAPDAAAGRAVLLAVLLAQDGSTTRLCEAIAGGPIQVHVARQRLTRDVPGEVRRELPGGEFIERYSSLAADGEVMMDNLTYIAVTGLDPVVRQGLEDGTVPIGHLLERLWIRRRRLPAQTLQALGRHLWEEFAPADEAASRAYVIVTPEAPRFVIAETYRYGMLRTLPGIGAASSAEQGR